MRNLRMPGLLGGPGGIVMAGLQVHLDVGHAASYDGSAQQWSDIGPLGHHLYRGATSGAEASDPSYNAGPPAYFSFDGADYFTSRFSGAGTFIRKIGRQDQPFTLEAWVYRAASGDSALQSLFTNGLSGALPGFSWSLSGTTAGRPAAEFDPTGGTTVDATTTLTAGAWDHLAFAGRGDGSTCTFYKSGAADGTTTLNNTGFTAGDSNDVPQIGFGGGSTFIDNGARLAIFRAYDRVLSAAEILQNFGAERGRFGI